MISDKIAELRRELAESPPTAEAHLRLGTALLKCNAAREAERELRAALALDPKCAGAWVNLGGILLARWEYGASIEANRKAVAADPNMALAHFNQAIGHLHLGEPEEAANSLNRVVELEPQNGGAYYHLGICLYALKRTAEAKLCVAYSEELGYRPSRVSAEALAGAAAAATDNGAPTSSQSEEAPSTRKEREDGTAQGR
jgi:tetratricopeptide (TPR) repeat protein